MKKTMILALLTTLFAPWAASAAEDNQLDVFMWDIKANEEIPTKYAFCMPDGKGKTKDGGNISPAIMWSRPPEATKSFAVIVVDKDVPAKFDDANQEGKVIATDFPRQDFYHWVLVDIPKDIHLFTLDEGLDSRGITPAGKPVGKTAYGVNGQNDYATFMKGAYGGYDGPCPPWNDARRHHYHFQVYALDVPTLGLKGAFNGKQAMEAINKHTLAKGELVATFSNYQP
jgi:Raf kinase inhibitor-like YbhB/YbcL family protein